MPLLTIDNLELSRGSRRILKELCLTVNPGDRIVIRGENGSGKTSLLQAVLGILPTDSGDIRLKTQTVGSRSWQKIRNSIAWVPQDGILHRFPIAAEEVVAVGLAARRIPRKERISLVRKAMEATGAAELEGRCYHRLSGGERRRLSLARCLAQGAELILLDEPAAALDAESRDRLVNLIESLTDVAVVAVTHDDKLFSVDSWTHLYLEEGILC